MDAILIAQRKQRMVWGVATALIALLGLAQRDQRDLLPGLDTPMTESAFAAITPQAPGQTAGITLGGTGQAGAPGVRRSIGRTGRTGTPQFTAPTATAPTGAASSVFTPPAVDSTTAAPSALLALADTGGSGGINPGPGSGGIGNIPTISPGGPQQTVSGADPGAVPEAPMWAIMILGVGGIGCMARRERSRGRLLFGPQIA